MAIGLPIFPLRTFTPQREAASPSPGQLRVGSTKQENGATMPQFDPELIQMMRRVLEEAMTRVPPEQSTSSAKAYLAECILKAAAQGQTNYDALLAAATDQLHAILSLLT
jgi:hypothetical protein